MLLYILATCCVALSVGYKVPRLLTEDYDVSTLEWPEEYMVKATKVTLTTGLVEDFSAWKTNASSRVDYNHGAVKRITIMSNDLSDGDKYEIHPETTDDEYNTLKCYNIGEFGSESVKMDTVLPDLNDTDYVSVGEEDVLGKTATKFEYNDEEDENQKQIKRAIWAVYEVQDDGEDGWTPIRYEVKTFNNKLGSLIRHFVFDYFDFYVDLEEDDLKVFDVIDQFDCDNYMALDSDSDAVTKDLIFIDPEDPKHVDHVFKSFKNEFQRQYADEKEHALRRSLFQNSMRLVSSVNQQNLNYTLSINQFADRTPEEMKRHTGLLKRPEGKSGNIPFPYTEATLKGKADGLPKEYDLRLLGVVSPVKSQGTCGSCWTFGTTAAVEGALARVNGGRVLSLANQAIIDCAWDGAMGCNGGSDDAAYTWMMKYGLPTEEEYGSYQNYDGYCNIHNMTKLYPIQGYTDVTPFSIEALKVALVNHGPLSVSVHVSKAFQLYSGGIFFEPGCSTTRLNHEVALVGYSVKDGELFWILKNSWGTAWGIDGYMHIAARNNNCGVATEPTYVVF